MIQALADGMARYVVKNDETADQEVLAYGYGLLIMAASTYFAVITSALLLGVFREMIIAMGVYMLMRTTIGGCHANHRVICFVSYSGVLYLSIVLAGFVTVSWQIAIALYLVNVMLIVLFAPGDTAEQPIVKNRFLRRITGVIFITCLFSTYIFFSHMQTEVNIAMFVSTSTCVFLHPLVYKAYGCERSTYQG